MAREGTARALGPETVTSGGLPRLRLPRLDPQEIAGLTQEQLAPTRAELSRAIQSVQAQRFGSPVAKGEVLRRTIRGAGEALGGAQAAATRTAYGLYRPEFEARTQEALARYRLELEEDERERQEAEFRKQEVRQVGTGARFPGEGETQTIIRSPFTPTRTISGTSTITGLERASARPGGLEPLPERTPSFRGTDVGPLTVRGEQSGTTLLSELGI